MVDTSVTELGDIKGVIRSEAVGSNPLADDGHKRLGFGIGDDGGNHVTSPF